MLFLLSFVLSFGYGYMVGTYITAALALENKTYRYIVLIGLLLPIVLGVSYIAEQLGFDVQDIPVGYRPAYNPPEIIAGDILGLFAGVGLYKLLKKM